MRAIAGNPRQLSTRFLRSLTSVFLRFVVFLAPTSPALVAAPSLPYAARGLLLDAALNGHAIVAVGERGAIIRSVDSGDTWEVLASPTHATLTGIAFASPNAGWAVGHDGVILHTRDGGETWTEQFHAEDRETVFLDVAAIDSTRAIAVGAFGVCYTTKDSGKNWLRQNLIEEDNHLNRITRANDTELFIAGERGMLLRLPAFNKPVQQLPSPHEVSFYGITPLPGDAVLAYGLRGHIYRSPDDGATWKRVESPLPALFSTALKLKSGTIVIAGQARAFLVSQDGGSTFRIWQPPVTTAVAEILEAPNGLLLLFGEAGVTRLDPPDNNAATAGPTSPAQAP